MRLADYIIRNLADHGVRHIFMVTGGGAMHLNDAIGREARLQYICNHHEQACAMAAESYARLSGKMAVVNVTSGPGAINTLNGVFGAWTDSIPMLVISGQVKRETLMSTHSLTKKLRQLGDQESNIVSMVESITKYAVTVTEPRSIRYHLEKSLFLATSGRPGPCWIDIPVDIQGAEVDPAELTPYQPDQDIETHRNPFLGSKKPEKPSSRVYDLLRKAARPLVMVGSGVRVSGQRDQLIKLLNHWKIPVVTAWNAHDLVWNTHPHYAGRPGTVGDRAGNFAVQNADCLLVLGSRLNIRQVSYNWKSFARNAFKIVVDIDRAELEKPTWKPDLPIHADLKTIFEDFFSLPPLPMNATRQAWLNRCLDWRKKYPVVLPEYRLSTARINPYCFVETLFSQLEDSDIIVCGDGTACVTTFQAAELKENQRLYTNSGCASMGYDLPAALGACVAANKNRVICIAGDGSIQMNLQELQTIVTHSFPIKIFVLNNEGYHSIRQTQNSYFPGHTVGCGKESGLTFPNFQKLASAYGIPHFLAQNHIEMPKIIKETLQTDGPCLCEIALDLNQQFSPKLSARKLPDGTMQSPDLEDLSPFLDRKELEENMRS